MARRLSRAGFIAARAEARELISSAAGDVPLLNQILERRLTGEPLAWITGSAVFCGVRVRVSSGVFVPRWHSEVVTRRAIARLPSDGTAIDVCTGSGAVALALRRARPAATILATDIDPVAIACAVSNGVDARLGDLFAPVPASLYGQVDVVVGVVPYVPHDELPFLQRDTFTFESTLAYDGGGDGAAILRRVVAAAPRLLKPGGALLLEVGGNQPAVLQRDLQSCGFGAIIVLRDDDGDVRGIEATLTDSPAVSPRGGARSRRGSG